MKSMSEWKRNTTTEMYQRIAIPQHYLAAETKDDKTIKIETSTTYSFTWDSAIFFLFIFLREFVSTVCLLVLNSRLGGDLFIAGPIVTLYINIVFRRPLNNPYVALLACASSGDWKNANVAGYPGFNKTTTSRLSMFIYFCILLTAELLGAFTAAEIRAHNDGILGYEFIKGAAWGSGQMYFKVNDMTTDKTCWNSTRFPNPTATSEISVRLDRSDTHKMLKSDACIADIQWRWWMAEDFGATLFLIVAYVHAWRWLRAEDMERSNPSPRTTHYWEEIITFSAASASLGFMTAIAFPTAHAGLHTSLFLLRYQDLTTDKTVTSNTLGEPYYRGLGGILGCVCAVAYEYAVAKLNEVKRGNTFTDTLHKMLYFSEVPESQ